MASPDFTEVTRRVERASSFRREILELAADHRASHPLHVETVLEGRKFTVYARTTTPFPPDIPLIFSDWTQQLRAALDATLYQVAVADTGLHPPPDDHLLQYPIEETPASYARTAKRRLKHLTPTSVKEIENTQPFNIPTGAKGHALWWLHELARTDRHRMAHEFDWHVRGVQITGPALAGCEAEHCDQEMTFLPLGQRTMLASITLAPRADTTGGLDMSVSPWPEIPRWYRNVVPSYRFNLFDRMENLEEVILRTAEYFRDRE